MLLKFLCCIDTSIRKQIKFIECVYHKSDLEKYDFLNMCNLCKYTQFSQAQLHIYLWLQAQDVGQFKEESNDNKLYEGLYTLREAKGAFLLGKQLGSLGHTIYIVTYNRLDMGSKFCRHVHNVAIIS